MDGRRFRSPWIWSLLFVLTAFVAVVEAEALLSAHLKVSALEERLLLQTATHDRIETEHAFAMHDCRAVANAYRQTTQQVLARLGLEDAEYPSPMLLYIAAVSNDATGDSQ